MAPKSTSLPSPDVNTAREPKSVTASSSDHDNIFYLLVAFRLLNAFTIFTFFQPDEYYQSLEPAWWFAFGNGSGAWITWVRVTGLYMDQPLTHNRNGRTSFDPPSTQFSFPSSIEYLSPSANFSMSQTLHKRTHFLLRQKYYRRS